MAGRAVLLSYEKQPFELVFSRLAALETLKYKPSTPTWHLLLGGRQARL